MPDITMPELPGHSVRVLRWLRASGESIATGEPLLVVLTPLVEALLPAPSAGMLAELVTAEGGEAAAGAVLARLAPAADSATTTTTTPPATVATPTSDLAIAATPDRLPSQRATPLALRIATTLGLDITALRGSGPNGQVRKSDVLAQAAVNSQEMRDGGLEIKGSSTQQVAVNNTPCSSAVREAGRADAIRNTQYAVRNTHHIPHALTVMQVDMGAVAAYRAAHRSAYERRGLALTDIACVAYAVATVLPRHSLLNARWSDDGIIVRRRLHLRIADHVVRDAGDLTLRGMARAIGALQRQAPAQQLPSNQDADATFTLTATPEPAAWFTTLHIRAGESAMLHMGAVTTKPVVVDDAIVVRPTCLLTLAYDARVMILIHADAFLCEVRRRLENLTPDDM